jgi:hypothetical protein
MITQESVVVQLIRLVDRIPTPPPPPRRLRGRPLFYFREAVYEGAGGHNRQALA